MTNTSCASIEALSGKWRPELIYLLSRGCVRWATLIHSIPQAAPNVLTRQLRALEHEGFVQRIITSAHPPQVVEYSLTPQAQSLITPLNQLRDWCGDTTAVPDFSVCQRVVSSKWMLPILKSLSQPLRFGVLQEQLPGIARGVLASQLQEMCAMALVSQTRYEGFPPRVEYSLTDRGLALIQILIPD